MDFNDAVQSYISVVGSKAMVEDMLEPVAASSIYTEGGWLLFDADSRFIALVHPNGDVYREVAVPLADETHSVKAAEAV